MKSLFVSAILLVSSVSQATVYFDTASELPDAVQTKIEAALIAACPLAARADVSVVENTTQVQVDEVDQGVIDYYYSTNMTMVRESGDANRPLVTELRVESEWMAGANPTPEDYIRVTSIEGCPQSK